MGRQKRSRKVTGMTQVMMTVFADCLILALFQRCIFSFIKEEMKKEEWLFVVGGFWVCFFFVI